MPLRFACPTCGQRLSVSSQKAGKSAVCPKCKATIAIPAGAANDVGVPEPSAPPLRAPPRVSPAPMEERPLFDFDSGVEVVYESSPAVAPRLSRKRAENEVLDFDRIALPRYVVFAQGILLVAVGVICFLLGMAVGGAVSESGKQPAAVPITVNGIVATNHGGKRTPDAGAVVIFLPFDAKPDEKVSLIGLRPGDDPALGERGRNFLRLIGGEMAQCDQHGQYAVTLAEPGRYFQLVLSADAEGQGIKELAPQQVAQIGRFFDLTEDPLTEFDLQWRTESLRASRRVNVNFD